MTCRELANWLNAFLRVRDIPDDSLNGLQVDNSGRVSAVGLAVDASEVSIRSAAKAGADFLIVHHGLVWGKPAALVGPLIRRVRALLETDTALYAVHLPLDLHPEVGNNVELARRMGWEASEDFGEYHGTVIGRAVTLAHAVPLAHLVEKLRETAREEPLVWQFGPDSVRRVAVISGSAMGMLDQVAREGFDAYITGETSHSHYWFAKEAGINVLFGGHYATETLGVQALGGKIRSAFGLRTVFLDHPTGL
jgi:dinuclear metal center YbgI/SA1388 family protein